MKIFVAWLDDNEIDNIEWYQYVDNDTFWNLNSNNLNKFDENDTNRDCSMGKPPSHWMIVPKINDRIDLSFVEVVKQFRET